MTLDEAIEVQDAIEAIAEGCSREDYVDMHDSRSKAQADFAYDAALAEVWTFGTARKALNAVKSVIESHR